MVNAFLAGEGSIDFPGEHAAQCAVVSEVFTRVDRAGVEPSPPVRE